MSPIYRMRLRITKFYHILLTVEFIIVICAHNLIFLIYLYFIEIIVRAVRRFDYNYFNRTHEN